MMKFVAIDFDGVLAPAEKYYRQAEQEFFDLLKSRGVSSLTLSVVKESLPVYQKRSVSKVGFGVALQQDVFMSLAIDYAPSQIDAAFVKEIEDISTRLRYHDVEFYKDVTAFFAALDALHVDYAIITKGEHHHQQDKLARLYEHLADTDLYPEHCHIVPVKDQATYEEIMALHNVEPDEFLMVGDSMNSDILPVLEAGGAAIFMDRAEEAPYKWHYEHAESDMSLYGDRFDHAEDLMDAAKFIYAKRGLSWPGAYIPQPKNQQP